MRRISLALALVGAVAAGCGGGAGGTASSNNQKRGVSGSTFTLQVRGEAAFWDSSSSSTIILPSGGVVTSVPAGIDCGVDASNALHKTCSFGFVYDPVVAVSLVAANNAVEPPAAHAFAGSCSGQGACGVLMTSNQFVAVRFAGSVAGLGAHPNFSDPAVHVPEYMKWAQGLPGAYHCTDCHGSAGQGQGLAPSCGQCHAVPALPPTFGHAIPFAGTAALDAQHAAAFESNGQATCETCHGVGLVGSTIAPACASCHNGTTAPSFGAGPAAFLTTHGPLTASLPSTAIPTHGNNYFDYAQNVSGALDCTICHGTTLAGGTIAPACNGCHTIVGVPQKADWAQSGHQDPAGALGGHDSQSCRRCHNAQGFMDYVGADGSPANNLSGTFYPDALSASFSNGTQVLVTVLKCQTCHNSTIDPLTTAGLTKVLLAGDIANVSGSSNYTVQVDKSFGICVQCHQSGYSGSGLQTAASYVDANVATKVGGVALAVVTANKPASVLNGSVGLNNFVAQNSSTVLLTNVTNLTVNAYKGYTAMFRGEAINALNGARATVAANDASTVTLASALPAAPSAGVLYPVTSSAPSIFAAATGNTTTQFTRSTGTWTASTTAGTGQVGLYVYFFSGTCVGQYAGPVTANTTTTLTYPALATSCVPSSGDAILFSSTVADSAVLFPTATSGSTTQLFDTNRDPTVWTTNKWLGYQVRFLSGANAGKVVSITASDPTSITFLAALANPVAAGDLYEISVKSSATTGVSIATSHRLEAAATLFGADGSSWYQYPDKTYAATFAHNSTGGSCITCHDPHTLDIELATCTGCHADANGTATNGVIPFSACATPTGSQASTQSCTTSWTGSPSGVKSDVDALASALGTKLNSLGICFSIGATSVSVKPFTAGACNNAGAAPALTASQARAFFNWTFYLQGDPGAWAHNPDYVKQALYDSIVDLGGTLPVGVTVLNRP
jgi:hypothetical protein